MMLKFICLLALVAFAQAGPTSTCKVRTYDASIDELSGKLVNNNGLEAFKLQFVDNPNGQSTLEVNVTLKPNTNQNLPPSSNIWLVISDGNNPKGEVGEYIIFYACANSDFASLYVYNGVNAANSFDENKLASYGKPIFLGKVAMTVTPQGMDAVPRNYYFKFDHDVTKALGVSLLTIRQGSPTNYAGDISKFDGASFGSKIGVWMHTSGDITSSNDQCTFDQDGRVTKFSTGGNLWLDFSNHYTTTTDCPQTPPPPAPGPVPPCDAYSCCGSCNDQCAMPVPTGGMGMACMQTDTGTKCSYSSDKSRIYVDGSGLTGAGSD